MLCIIIIITINSIKHYTFLFSTVNLIEKFTLNLFVFFNICAQTESSPAAFATLKPLMASNILHVIICSREENRP